MKAYTAYKRWWIENQSPHYVGSLYWGRETAEECFAQHVKDLGVYGLFEMLQAWDEE
jgi:hypothetical protein